jgi:hypothetical protein
VETTVEEELALSYQLAVRRTSLGVIVVTTVIGPTSSVTQKETPAHTWEGLGASESWITVPRS